MKKIDKKLIIIIVVVALIILGTILLIVFNTNKNDNNTAGNETVQNKISLTKEEMEDFVKRINEINANFTEDKLGEEYPADNSLHEQYPDIIPKKVCHKYIGDNTAEIDRKLNSLYLKPYSGGTFSIISTKESDENAEEIKETLIICLPENCELDTIKSYKFEDDVEDLLSVYFDDVPSEILEDNTRPKIAVPVISCKK